MTKRCAPAPIGRPPTGLPRRSRQIKIQVTEELYGLIAAAAQREKRSISDWGMQVFEREVTSHAPRGDAEDERLDRANLEEYRKLEQGKPHPLQAAVDQHATSLYCDEHKQPAPRRKRCPRCNQLLPVVDGEIEPHNRPSPPFELCSRKPRIGSTPIVRRTKP